MEPTRRKIVRLHIYRGITQELALVGMCVKHRFDVCPERWVVQARAVEICFPLGTLELSSCLKYD